MANYIRNRKVEKGKMNDVPELKGFSEATWSFISSIYESEWDSLYIDKDNRSFRQKVVSKFTPKVPKSNLSSDSLVHPYQIQSTAISRELTEFFKRDYSNVIEFWDCSSQDKWTS
ncbi:hypothetical protein Ac2012v2_002151 [Leucoagaricus gongylophorus]